MSSLTGAIPAAPTSAPKTRHSSSKSLNPTHLNKNKTSPRGDESGPRMIRSGSTSNSISPRPLDEVLMAPPPKPISTPVSPLPSNFSNASNDARTRARSISLRRKPGVLPKQIAANRITANNVSQCNVLPQRKHAHDSEKQRDQMINVLIKNFVTSIMTRLFFVPGRLETSVAPKSHPAFTD